MKTEREQHLQWCKDRAKYYLDINEPGQAIASFISDMNKHEETRNHIALEIAPKFLIRSKEEIRDFINGFQ